MQTTLTELSRESMKTRMDDAPPGEPPGHRLLVKIVTEEKRKGKIIIPEENKTSCEIALAVAVGRNAFMGYGDSHPWCQAGDKIGFVRYAGKDIEFLDGEEYRVINDEDVYYVYERGE